MNGQQKTWLGTSPRCIASPRRLRWAMLRAGWPAEKSGVWMAMAADPGIGMEDARLLARDAEVSLAALYLPDPGRWQMFRAWLHGAVGSPPASSVCGNETADL